MKTIKPDYVLSSQHLEDLRLHFMAKAAHHNAQAGAADADRLIHVAIVDRAEDLGKAGAYIDAAQKVRELQMITEPHSLNKLLTDLGR